MPTEFVAAMVAPDLLASCEKARHIGCGRTYWFTEYLGEDGGEEMQAYTR